MLMNLLRLEYNAAQMIKSDFEQVVSGFMY